jgi:molecular chaperone HscB
LEAFCKSNQWAHANEEQKEQEFADQQSTFINKAYNILKDPLTRSIYLVIHFNFMQESV